MSELDYDDSTEVAEGIYWVGFDEPDANFHANPYLMVESGEAVIFDPGSLTHFPIVMRKVIDIIQPEKITAIIVHHQDPDVCGSLAVVDDIIGTKNLSIIAHPNTIRLISDYGGGSSFIPAGDGDFKYRFKSGREIEFIPTPFLHSPGAMVSFDATTGTLFSSDIFGAISTDWSLYSNGSLDALTKWHQTYMPSNAILRRCMEKFETMNIKRVLPQHGSILQDGQVSEAIDYLKELKCGVDIL